MRTFTVAAVAIALAGCGGKTDKGVPVEKDGSVDWGRVEDKNHQAASLYAERKMFSNCDRGYGSWGRVLVGDTLPEPNPNAEIDAQRYRSIGYLTHCMTAMQPLVAKTLADGKITWGEYRQISAEHDKQWYAEKDAWDAVRDGLAAKGFEPLTGAGY